MKLIFENINDIIESNCKIAYMRNLGNGKTDISGIDYRMAIFPWSYSVIGKKKISEFKKEF